MRFFDASALVKRYVLEPGSTTVRRLLLGQPVAVSRLSEVEVASALARLVREGSLTAASRDEALAAFGHDFHAWHVVEISPDIASRAQRLLGLRDLRSGDAIQLATAQLVEEALGSRLDRFVVYDRRLGAAARAEGFRTNPLPRS